MLLVSHNGLKMEHAKLSNIQMELLKVYSTNLTKTELNDVKSILANYFAEKAINQADEVWNANKISDETMDSWLEE